MERMEDAAARPGEEDEVAADARATGFLAG